MIKVAIISCGMIANNAHIPAYKHFSEDFEIVAVQDINETAARETAKRHGIKKYYTDARKMLEHESPDLVSVCVPNCFHKEYTVMALSHGANVLCEKPLAVSYSDAKEMFEFAGKKGKLLMACQSMRFTSDRLAAKEYIDKKGIDDIYYGEISRIRRRGIPFWGTFHMKKFSCGGAFIDIGVHMLDALVWLMGNPEVNSVKAVTMQNHKNEIGSLEGSGALMRKVDVAREFNPDEMDVEDFSCGMITFKNGAIISFKVAWAANMPERSDIRLIGKKRGIYIPECKVYYDENGIENISSKELMYDSPFAGHYYIADNLRKVLKGEEKPCIKPEETINVTKITDLFYRSAELGREIRAEELV